MLDGKAEAIVIATACSPVPEGRATWTARMIADRLVELQVVESVSEDTILRDLKKVNPKPWQKRSWCLPKGVDGELIHRMEDVLELYAEPRDPVRPVVCLNEASKELHGE